MSTDFVASLSTAVSAPPPAQAHPRQELGKCLNERVELADGGSSRAEGALRGGRAGPCVSGPADLPGAPGSPVWK